MAFLSIIRDFFESLFGGSLPEVKIKHGLRQIESALKNQQPLLYKNGMVQPNFAEALHVLYAATRSFKSVLAETLMSSDVRIRGRYTEQLFFTNLREEDKSLYNALSYENRRQEALDSGNASKTYDEQRRKMDKFLACFSSPEFAKIDIVIQHLEQFSDVCNFNYLSILKRFDPQFDENVSEYKPVFQPVPIDTISTVFADLYYLASDIVLTTTIGKALIALIELRGKKKLSALENQQYMENLRKIAYVFNHILTSDQLQKLAAIAEKNPDIVLKKAEYKPGALVKLTGHIRERFDAEQKQIVVEVQDTMLQQEIGKLFKDRPLEQLSGYNMEVNSVIKQTSSVSFEYILPIQTLKTFFVTHIDERIQSLLNDIVIEGFFNNSTYKTDFSSLVFACLETFDHIKAFEKEFDKDGKHSQAVLLGYVNDSHKDPTFADRLADEIVEINNDARKLLHHEVNALYHLHQKLQELLLDVKKSRSDVISNIRVLFSSTRNKDAAELLEHQFPDWQIFLDIMGNYTVVSDNVKTHD